MLHATGDAPISWLEGAATVVVRADEEVLGRFVFADEFDFFYGFRPRLSIAHEEDRL
jgi:hypothetical protein